MSEPDLLFEVKGHVAWLTLNREAQRNAISPNMIDLFGEYLDRIEKDADIRVVCVTGAGPKVFCSGADLGAALSGGDAGGGALKYARLIQRMSAFPKPFVAKLNGHCLAGGMGLMMVCDMVYAREGITVGTPEVKVGLFPMMVCALLFRNTLRKKALEMVFTGARLGAEEAEGMGLITRVFKEDAFDEAVEGKLQAVAGNAPLAVQIGRQALAEAEDMPINQALEHLASRLGDVLKTEDAMEGLSAFLTKRKPEWKGK